jgi:hypothetical protein
MELSYTDLVREFHEAAGHLVPKRPVILDEKTVLLRLSLITSEVGELADAARTNDLIGVADALADIIYVAIGWALAAGIDMDRVFHEVHASNMTKMPPVYDAGGKVCKPETYRPVCLDWLLA